MSSDLAKGSKKVKVDGNPVALKDSNFSTSTGDEAGSAGGGVVSNTNKGKAEFVLYSFDGGIPHLLSTVSCGTPPHAPPPLIT